MREGEKVTSLELFFDLVFVLALTQCTALMVHENSWAGVGKGLLVLAVMWWSWCGYAWLTSVVDPEEGAVRLVIFAAMAALLVGRAVRAGRVRVRRAAVRVRLRGRARRDIALFTIASRDDDALRRSVSGLAWSTAVGVGLLVLAASPQGRSDRPLVPCDRARHRGPYMFGIEGWKLVPEHFRAPRRDHHHRARRVDRGHRGRRERERRRGRSSAPRCSVSSSRARSGWLYFDVVAIAAERRLVRAGAGRRERNAIARDSYSYLHFPMVAGIALIAVGMKQTLAHVSAPLGVVAASAMLGGAAMYLLAHVAFRWRNMHTSPGTG